MLYQLGRFFEIHHQKCLISDRSLFFFGASPLRLTAGKFVKSKTPVSLSKRVLAIVTLIKSSPDAAGILISSPNSKNYAHWLTNTLPNIYLLNKQQLDIPVIVPYCLHTQSYVRDLLNCFPNVQTRFLGERQSLLVSALVTPNALAFRRREALIPELVEFLKNQLSIHTEHAPTRRIFVSRSGRRRIANEEEIIEMLHVYDFEVVRFEEYGVREQFAISAESAVMLGAHGAGLANSIFMPNNSTLIEFDYPMPSKQEHYFFRLSNIVGNNHYFVRGRRSDFKVPLNRNENYVVNLRELDTFLDLLFTKKYLTVSKKKRAQLASTVSQTG